MKSAVIRLLERIYGCFIFGGNLLQHVVLLVFRLYWGWQFFETGQGKLGDLGSVTDYFTSLHIPFPGLNAAFIGALECFGGLLLFVGLASRPVALLLTGSMTGAYLLDPDERAKVLNIFHDPDAFLTATPFFFWLAAILVLSFGPGIFSIDGLLGRFVFKKKGVASATPLQ